MRSPTDKAMRAEATTEGGFLTPDKVAANRNWFVQWDAYCAECEFYDLAVTAALKPGFQGSAPKAPRSFWGKGRPHPPFMPPIVKPPKPPKPPKALCAYVTLTLPLPVAVAIDSKRGELSAAQYCTNLVTSILGEQP